MPAKDEWEDKFKKWKEDKEKKLSEIDKIEREIVKAEKAIAKEIKTVEKEVVDYAKEPKHVKTIKIIAILIPIIILGFIIYANFISSQTFDYTYDIGSPSENSLTPVNRISEQVEGEINYRNLTGGLVYFDVPVARGSETITVQTKFKNTVPEGWTLSLGAKNQDVWHYTYNPIYNPALNQLAQFEKEGNVYKVNPSLPTLTFEELKEKDGVVIATDEQYVPSANIVSDYKEKDTKITTSLRGAHTAYIYASGDISLTVKKQDINWYEGSDELVITIYDLENNLIANTTIPDDGTTEIKSKIAAPVQEKRLEASDLQEGVYKIEFGEFDGVIREISINTNKIVFTKLFLADTSLYNVQTKSSSVYTKVSRNEQLELVTYHKEGIQNINYTQSGVNKRFNFYQEDAPLYIDLPAGEYVFVFPKNDIILSGSPYLSFSRENYFEPFKQKIVPIKNDFAWLQRNVDYIVTDYTKPEQEGEWLVAETTFNIQEENLFVKDNKLSFVFNIPHLSQEDLQNYTIPIDWIKISVHKPGAFEK